jgi:hypothetical protein
MRIADAYRLDDWKLVQDYRQGVPEPAELYDLAADPAETTDLAAAHPDTVAALLERLPYGRPPAPDTVGLGGTPVGTAPPPAEPAATLRVLPNPGPARAPAVVALFLPHADRVRVEAFDARGRQLALLHDGPLGAGPHRLALPGGSAGVVVVRATGAFGTLVARTARLR